jgi:aminoglycoside phosphotransferase (APT) family kinase protein
LVHGDFHYGNVLYRDGDVAAIIDWEIASLGDARLDLGCLGVASLRRKYAPEANTTGSVEVGFDELMTIYGEPGVDLEWFLAEACLKYAAILGYNLNLHRSGRRPDPVYEEQLGTMRGLVDDGLDALEGRLDFT